jgi:hypothetical protein
VTVLKDRQVPAPECFAVQNNLVLVGPQHGPCLAPDQRSFHCLTEIVALEVKGIVYQARTKASSNLVRQQQAVAIVYPSLRTRLCRT